jgi:hypothetical protein
MGYGLLSVLEWNMDCYRFKSCVCDSVSALSSGLGIIIISRVDYGLLSVSAVDYVNKLLELNMLTSLGRTFLAKLKYD